MTILNRGQWVRSACKGALVGAFTLLAGSGIQIPLTAQDNQVPPPEVAAKQFANLTPEELTRLEIDEVTRDRLRFDPNWQPMLEAVRRDIMVLKWGKGALTNPMWQQYGAKAYPLLEFYSRSSDSTRQRYGIVGIRSLGKPYTTLWLRKQVQQNGDAIEFYNLTENPRTLLTGDYSPSDDQNSWQQEFGLDDPKTRADLVRLAKERLAPRDSPAFYDQFNVDFLGNLEGYDTIFPNEPDKPEPRLPEWTAFSRLTQPTGEQIQAAIAYYQKLPRETQKYLLTSRLGQIKAGKVDPIGKALLHHLANSLESIDRVWAIAELVRHGDPQALVQAETLLNQDIQQLRPLTQLVSYERGDAYESHAYYLLLGLVERYPKSRFAQACREYGDLTGRSYFGGEPRSKILRDRLAKKSPAQQVKDWQQWLKRYPDHPGVDDATYFLALNLQFQNDILNATRQWVRLMTTSIGDSDALYLAYPHIRTLLDVGLTTQQLQTLLKEPEMEPIAPLFRYALAVRYARLQNYAGALELAEDLNLTTMSDKVLGSYYNSPLWAWWQRDKQPDQLQQEMQATLNEQRQRWQQLQSLSEQNTPTARYLIASNWAGIGGWKNGYLPVWDRFRTWLLPTTFSQNQDSDLQNMRWDCRYWWACDLSRRNPKVVRSTYQAASQNAVALSIYQGLLNDSTTPNDLREKALYMTAMTLLRQWENYPQGETERIHPPAGVVAGKQKRNPDSGEMEYNIGSDYSQRINRIITELQTRFPKSSYIDDLLFSNYYLTGQPRYLQQLVGQYPGSDRAAEARFLLENRK